MLPTPTTVSVYATDEDIHLALCDECHRDLGWPYVWQKFADEHERCCVCGDLNSVDVIHVDEYWQDKPQPEPAPRKHILKVEPVMLDVLPPDMDGLGAAIRRFQRSMGA